MTYYELDYSQKLDFIKRLILTHMTDEYPYYVCQVATTEYECCFAGAFSYRSGYNSLYLASKNYFNIKSTPINNDYAKYKTIKEYNKNCLFYTPNSGMPALGNIDSNNSEFLRFSNFDFSTMKSDTYFHFYITDLLATTTSSTSVVDDGGGSSTSSNTDTLLVLISAILLLIFLTGFIRSLFFKR